MSRLSDDYTPGGGSAAYEPIAATLPTARITADLTVVSNTAAIQLIAGLAVTFATTDKPVAIDLHLPAVSHANAQTAGFSVGIYDNTAAAVVGIAYPDHLFTAGRKGTVSVKALIDAGVASHTYQAFFYMTVNGNFTVYATGTGGALLVPSYLR